MAPPAQKRKRNERTYSSDNMNQSRPSPHRPENLALANGGRGGGRRPSRGGRGGAGAQSPLNHTNANAQAVASPTPAAKTTATTMTMHPPPQPASQAVPKAAQTADLEAEAERLHLPPSGSPPKPDTSTYHYDYITSQHAENWVDTGRQAVVDDLLARAAAEDLQELGVFFQEVIHLVFEGLINPQDAGTMIKEILEKAENAELLDLPSLLLDNVSVVLDKHNVDGKEVAFQLFLRATGIDVKLMGMVLDIELLEALGIVRSEIFMKMAIRHGTNVLYRQSGFNLLREETEGYSKVMTEFFTITHNFKADKETIEMTWEKVKALIGAFDLDVGRVLDIMLDVFANNIIRHNKFFIRLLMISDWWPKVKNLPNFLKEAHELSTLPPWADINYPSLDTQPEDTERILGLRHGRDIMFWEKVRQVGVQAFFELGGRRAIRKGEERVMFDKREEEEAFMDDEWAAKTGTYPASGSWNAAQILGFKLRFYASDARDATDKLTDNLVWLAALLIKIGFISLKDLYPHIYPSDEQMQEVRQRLEKEKEERIRKLRPGGGTNALTMAGALADGDGPVLPATRSLQDTKPRSITPMRTEAGVAPAASTSSQTETPKPEKPLLPEPVDQKILLLKSLLLVGAIPDAMYILSRFPWLLDLHDDLPKYIFRLLHHMLRKVYIETQPLSGRASDTAPGTTRVEINNQPLLEARKDVRSIAWGQMEKVEWSESDYGTRYRFYWDDWNDLVPVCQNVDDVFTLCESFLNLVGHKIGRDSELLTKLVRIGVKSLKGDDSSDNYQRWQKLAKRLLIPALSLTKEDPSTVNEAWELLKLFPVAVRYNIYAEWFSGQTSRLPDIKAAFDLSRSQTKDVLKRISKTNIKAMARALAKVAYSSPGVALSTTLTQIESYNNLIEVVIECVRYFTNIGFDVLIWSLLNSLGGSRNRMQADGMLMSNWLKRLAEFTGKVSKRYYKDLDLKPLLLYVKDQLEKGNSTDLGVLGQMVFSMGGIKADQNWNEEQIIALSGRNLIRAGVLKAVVDKRFESKSSSARLVGALTSTHLAGRLLILIALERQKYLERESSSGAPIKVLSANLTGLQYAFVQYLDFLRSNFSIEEFDAIMPAVEDLIRDYGIEPAIAFTISRPSIQHQIEQAKNPQPLTNGDVEMTDTVNTQASLGTVVNGSSAKEDVAMGEATQTDAPGLHATNGISSAVNLHPVLQQVAERLRAAFPPDFEEKMSMSFYVRFWQSSLSDVLVPSYDSELKEVKRSLQAVINDRSDMSVFGAKKKEARKKDLSQMEKALQDEWKASLSHINAMKKVFTNERVLWFKDFAPTKHNALTDAIVQECLLPRIVLSEADALFTAKFIFFVHKASTPGFRIAKILSRFFNEQQFIATLFMLTEREAKNLGIFLKEVLGQLRIWRENKQAYEREGAGPNNENPGFAKRVQEDNSVDGKDPDAVLDHPDFQRLLYKWHAGLNKGIEHCLQSKEFMHIRNAILFLKQVHEHFPALNFMGKAIESQVLKLAKEETREDLKLSASSLLADLQKMRLKWIGAPQFRPGEGPPSSTVATTDSRSASTRPATPLSGSGPARPLNAAAAEFQPNGTRHLSLTGAEDGEIDDSKEVTTDVTAIEPAANPDDPAATINLRPGTPTEPARASTPSASARLTQTRSDGRPSTPAGTSTPTAAPAPRGEANRTPSSSTLGVPSNLPPRPDGPFPPARDLHRRPEERTSLPPRLDPRAHEHHGRLDRPGDPIRDIPRRRSRSPGRHGRIRSPDIRPPRTEQDRREPGYGPVGPRELQDSRGGRVPLPRDMRDSRDERHRAERDIRRPLPEPRAPLPEERPSRPAEASSREPGPLVNPERAAQIDIAGMNPARAALFEQDTRQDERDRRLEDDRRGDRRGRGHGPRDEPRALPPVSRGSSPHSERRSERAGPERPPRSGPRDRRDEPVPVPSGPLADRVTTDNQRGRGELFPGTSRGPNDSGHNRMSQESSRSQQDPNFGRLNAPPSAETPSGPRGRASQRNLRAGTDSVAPSGPRSMAPSSPATQIPPPSPGPERAPPSGPLGNNRRASGQGNSAPASAPQGPAADVAGIHPSRRLQIDGPPAIQTTAPSASSGASAIPSGPRSAGGNRNAPAQSNMLPPSPNSTRAPPRGPSSSGSGRESRMLGAINGILGDSRPSNAGTPIRGRASLSSQSSAPPSPAGASAPTPTNPTPSRPDGFLDRVDLPSPSAGDEHHGNNNGRREPRDDGRGSRRHRERSRSPRRDAADNAMRASGDMPPRGPPNGPDDRNRRREGGERDREREGVGRDRRSRGGGGEHGRDPRDVNRDGRDGGRRDVRDGRDTRDMRNQGPPPQSMYGPGGVVPPPPPGAPPSGPNGDVGGRPGRRDDRERRDDGHRGGGDRGKRRRPEDGPPGMHDIKRPRRGQ